jgi:hypothetical protein
MPSMVRKLSIVAIVALAALSVSAVAFAAPATMNLSSWEPTVDNGAIVGGTRTVTLTNVTSETINDVAYELGPAPCDCSVTSTTPSYGSVSGDAWTVDTLGPGETITLTLTYGEPPVVAVGAAGIDSPTPIGIELAVFGLGAGIAIIGTIRRRYIPAIG